MTDTMTDLEQVQLPPGIDRADFDTEIRIDKSPRFVAVFVPAKQLGAIYQREAKQWIVTHPIQLETFADSIRDLLAADTAAGAATDEALERVTRH
jgi:hypothetical protein